MSSNQEQERAEKQNYLREQIIDKGLDGYKFQEFLESKKENGSEIDTWSMLELKKLVKQFQKLQANLDQSSEEKKEDQKKNENENHQQQENQQNNENGNQYEEIKAEQLQENQPKQDKFDIIYGQDESISSTLKCEKVDENDITKNPQVIAQVKKFTKVEGGIFSSSYVIYNITTLPFNWEVSRRFNEFYTLREILTKLYPAYLIPPIPKKTSVRSYQNLFIQKRMAFFEKFLNKVLKSPELRACKYVEAFLKISDQKEFIKIFKDADKIVKVPRINKQQSLDGTIKLEYNKQVQNYLEKAGEFLNSSEAIYKKIRKLSKILILDFDKLSSTIYMLGDCFSNLYTLSSTFNKGVDEGKNLLLNDIYVTLNNMKVSWGDAISSQIQLISDNLCNHYKYYHQEIFAAKDLLKNQDHVFKDFLYENKRLLQKKDKLFQLQNPQFYEIPKEKYDQYTEEEKTKLFKDKKFAFAQMLPKESAYENYLRYQNAYYTNVAFEEIKRCFSDKIKEYSSHFMNFGKLQSENISQIHLMWADTMTNLSNLEVGKKMIVMRAQPQPKQETQEAVAD